MENLGLIQKTCFETHGQKFTVNCDTGSLFVANNGILYIYNDVKTHKNLIDYNEETRYGRVNENIILFLPNF